MTFDGFLFSSPEKDRSVLDEKSFFTIFVPALIYFVSGSK